MGTNCKFQKATEMLRANWKQNLLSLSQVIESNLNELQMKLSFVTLSSKYKALFSSLFALEVSYACLLSRLVMCSNATSAIELWRNKYKLMYNYSSSSSNNATDLSAPVIVSCGSLTLDYVSNIQVYYFVVV